MKHYDFIMAGGGLAGLSLAYHLVRSPLRDRSILVVDRDAESQRPDVVLLVRSADAVRHTSPIAPGIDCASSATTSRQCSASARIAAA
jgi:2-polyprenyl-6-methoxyphenol hydroxylase-like FAD-dependent oxidoreductase